MTGKDIINEIIKHDLVSANCEGVSVWREDSEQVIDTLLGVAKKPTCLDCESYFTNCFDEHFCSKGKAGTRVCREFVASKGETK